MQLFNDPGKSIGPQFFSVAQHGIDGITEELTVLRGIADNLEPSGPTFMAHQLTLLRQYLEDIAPLLRERNQNVTVLLATQGSPTDKDGKQSPETLAQFIAMLKSLESLPVWIVFRLCTDDERAFSFYNAIDSQINLPYDVLDDFFGESLEVYLHNPWLTYALPLHRFREMGFRNAALDVIDERALNTSEIRDLCNLLFSTDNELPDPCTDWQGFFNIISMLQEKEKKQWNPVKKVHSFWIDLESLNKLYSGGSMDDSGSSRRRRSSSAPKAKPENPQPSGPQKSETSEENQEKASEYNETQDPGELKRAILTEWALEPPQFRVLKPIETLLATVHATFHLVEYHDYFNKWEPFSDDALSSGGKAVLKRG
mmetsp:Transcript_4167/g.6137  ORF Transcript_4167/g.6137 Transcript_4167/m.6137 type:complete len:370 (-) Transcript_4167:259-1368(-)